MASTKHGRPSALAVIGVTTITLGIAGCGGKKSGYEGDGTSLALTPIASAKAFDAAPDESGENVFFTAIGVDGGALYRVSAEGGSTTELAVSGSFVAPVSLAVGGDGMIYVADPAAETGTDEDAGRLYAIPAAGGAPAPMASGEGKRPRGVAYAAGSVWFTGVDTDGAPAVFRDGTAVAKGAPMVEPQGIAVTRDGSLAFVIDVQDGELASVIEVDGASMQPIASGIRVGYPTGIALSNDESALLVSAYAPDGESDAVVRIDRMTGALTYETAGIESFNEPAGIHRAAKADVYAWADTRANSTGTVFLLKKSN